MNRTGARRKARALFRDGSEAFPFAAQLLHAHYAVMLAVAAAAWGEIRFCIGAKSGRDQHPTEDQRQCKCDRAAHGHPTVYPAPAGRPIGKTDLIVAVEHAPIDPASGLAS